MKVHKWLVIGLLTMGVMSQGCALLLVGAAAGAAAGTVSFVANELRVTHETTVDRAWGAATATLTELQFTVIQSKSSKDATGGVLQARNAKDQPVVVQLFRRSDRLTEVRVRVGTFDTTANRATAQLIYDKMRPRL